MSRLRAAWRAREARVALGRDPSALGRGQWPPQESGRASIEKGLRRFLTHNTIVWPNDHGPKPSSDAFCSSASVPESRPNRGGEDGQESR
jgi:hypothetical protein